MENHSLPVSLQSVFIVINLSLVKYLENLHLSAQYNVERPVCHTFLEFRLADSVILFHRVVVL